MRKLTLGDKLLLTLASLLVLEVAVRDCADWTNTNEIHKEHFMKVGRNHARSVACAAKAALERQDGKALESIADLLRAPDDTDLAYIAFYGPEGRLWASRVWSEKPVAVPDHIQSVHEAMVQPGDVPDLADTEHFKFLFPLVWTTPAEAGLPADSPASLTQFGTVVAVRSYENAKAKIAEEHQSMLLVTAAMLALGLSVLLVFARRLVAPVEVLVKGTERVAAGDFSTPVDVGPRHDELRTLADSFNRMTRQLADQREQILAHNRDLERNVDERTTELVEANRQLRQTQLELVQSEKMRMLGQLAAGVAHEINTPTGAILNVATDIPNHLQSIVIAAARLPALPRDTQTWVIDLVPAVLARPLQASDAATRTLRRHLEQELRKRGHAEYRRMAAVIIKCGIENALADDRVLKHLAQDPVLVLLERLEAMSSAAGITRLSAEKIARIVRALRFYTRSDQAEFAEVDVNETIDNTLAILQNRVKHVAEVRTEYARNLPPFRCEADISQVWTNLLNNACDAIEEAHLGRLGRIDIATSLQGDRIRVTIFNTGKPIPQENRQKIFDPFFTTKPLGKGTGLGLGICNGILRRCGGTIQTWNEDDGVTFEVTVPAAMPAAAAEPAAVGAAEAGVRPAAP